jgi:fibronectin type 3 domain-containing protein
MHSFAVIVITVFGLLSFSTAYAQEFKLYALSTDKQKNKIALTWKSKDGVTRYNLYRSTASGNYPSAPLNPTPIMRMNDCTAIQATLTANSFEWELIKESLKESKQSPPFDPCGIATLKIDAEDLLKYAALKGLARGNLKVAKVLGLAYEDNTVTDGTTYYYRIASVDANGNIISVLESDVSVTAGKPMVPPAPADVTAEAGDNQVLIRWKEIDEPVWFKVERTLPPQKPAQVNSDLITTIVTQTLQGDPLSSPMEGFLDLQRWDSNGQPLSQEVYHNDNGNFQVKNIDGPKNGTTYYYKISTVDFLGTVSPMNVPPVSATPKDATPPATPTQVSLKVDELNSSFEIEWEHVLKDINNHDESSPVLKYRLYRYESAGDPKDYKWMKDNIPGLGQQPGKIKTTDNSPELRSPYGDKTWWYRVEAVDGNGNVSARSAAVSGTLKDITPPRIVTNVKAEGHQTSIALNSWDQNSEPDLASYVIYRGLCDLGKWVECAAGLSEHIIPCFVYLGEVTKNEVKKALETGKPFYEDKTIPPESPLCYAYWVKAKDKSGNLSGGWPMPWKPDESNEIVCERLHDETPPEPALIAGLHARDDAILVEWIGPPTQDIRAYHVYRTEKDEPALYKWVGGMTVEVPPKPLLSPYVAPPAVGCDVIPAHVNEDMSKGSFLDTGADPKKIYWYKVVGIDFDGNEGPLAKAVGVSTFTFSTAQPTTPSISAISPQPNPCALMISWNPVFDNAKHKGFAVFKSRSATGPYFQAVNLLKENSFADVKVVKGVEYWYRIALLDMKGVISQLSAPQSGKVNP